LQLGIRQTFADGLMKQLFNPEDIERKVLLILRILNESPEPAGARVIARQMMERGVKLSERTVRYHLKLMDERGLTRLIGRRDGRIITQAGLDEITNARVQDKISLSISRIDVLSFKTTFSLQKKTGMVPVNISFFPEKDFKKALRIMKPVFREKIAVSERVAVAPAGNKLGEIVVPEGKIGLASVCSILINGILLKQGIPIDSKFAGILQVKNRVPLRFVELIHYAGSSLDPSEIFVRGHMTSVKQVLEKGEGKILANFREIPALSSNLVADTVGQMGLLGIHGVLSIGNPGNPVCQTGVDINKAGMILVGGLNPIAAVYESGIDVDNRAMSTVIAFEHLHSVEEL
jgi:HTH-type transcriptional regulator, global nitrogen regulator NrpRI